MERRLQVMLELLDLQVDKVVQLYETLMTRHTTMIVGPTGGGKTVVLGAMCRAQTIAGLPTKQFVINPKAIPAKVLYGSFDEVSHEWTDGIVAVLFVRRGSRCCRSVLCAVCEVCEVCEGC